MKGIFTIVVILFFFSSCKESGVQLAKPTTFVKYYSAGNQDEAIDILETSVNGVQGFLILAQADSAINVIKTDLSGNVTGNSPWHYGKKGISLLASNFVSIKDNSGNDQGYVIVGTTQNSSKTTGFGARLFVMRINTDGAVKDSMSYFTKFGNETSYRAGTGQYVIGKGVAQSFNSTNDIFVIGHVVISDLTTSAPTTIYGKGGDMYFSQISGSNLDTVFTRIYGGGTTDLASRLYLDYPQTSAYWGGTRADGSITHMRFTKSGFNTQQTTFDLTYPVGDNTGYTGNDFCTYGYGYAFIGTQSSTNKISVARVGSEGDLIGSITNYEGHLLGNPNLAVLPLAGNSVCSTQDGGLILLGTLSKDAQGTDKDYYLIKIKLDETGTGFTSQWQAAYGGKYIDEGVRVLQSSDGGYVILGTTTLANVKTVVLIKTDLQGNVQ